MYWANGSVYRGQWQHGEPNGIGLVVLGSTGQKKAGIFMANILIKQMRSYDEVDKTCKDLEVPCPDHLRQALKEHLFVTTEEDYAATSEPITLPAC